MTIEKLNPASAPAKLAAERKRVPMSVPVQRLETPEIPGYRLHWFTGSQDRIERAQSAGYEFVKREDLKLNTVSLGGDSTISGNTDMGSNVSIVSGQEVGKDGQPMRLILMKIKTEWYEEDQKLVDDRNEQTAAALRGGLLGSEGESLGDRQQRYVDKARTQIPDLFTPKPRKRPH